MDIASIGDALSQRAADDRFSGVVRIDQGDETVFAEAYGFASRAWQVPCRIDTRFDTASITKLFTAVATLQQVEAGAFALDTSVIDFLGLEGTTISPAVTPYHLLTHTSGIGDDADEEAGEDYADLFIDSPNYAIRETADFLPNFAHKPPNFAPGEGTRYNNVGYVLLGLMIEKASGVPYRQYATQHVFTPAGMTHSGFFRMDEVTPDLAEGVDPIIGEDGKIAGWRRNIYSYPPIGSPDGGAHVTAGDLIAFHRALREGRLLGGGSTTAMREPKEDYKPTDDGMHRTGFGFEFEVAPGGRVISYWKEGINKGASGVLSHFPEQDVTYVVLSNLEDGAWEPIELIERAITA